jgi:hypothetical protein
MKQRRQLARLSDSEASKARDLTRKHGAPKAARLLGLCDVRTLYKAIAQVDVSPLTASVVRTNLSSKL